MLAPRTHTGQWLCNESTCLVCKKNSYNICTLGNQSRSSGRVVFESGRNLLLRLVVASETVDTRLDENQAELGVLVLAVRLEMLAHGNRLFDEVPKVLRDGWAKSYPQTKGKRKIGKTAKKENVSLGGQR